MSTHTITIDVMDAGSIRRAIADLQAYRDRIIAKANELARRLAERGAVIASLSFARVAYTGPKDVTITVEARSANTYAIIASGETVLILEFGAGITYGEGHPQAGEFGYGPGTYPGQKHAMTGKGWYLPKEKGGGHTYGNPPSMAMYLAGKEIRDEVEAVAREVFST